MQSREQASAVSAFAAEHGGVLTAEFLNEAGFSRNMIDGRVRRHGWTSLGRGAYRLFPPRDHIDALRGAVAVMERVIVSHESAAELHEIRRVPWRRAVLTNHSRTTHRFEGVEIRRAHDIDEWHVTRLMGLPVTTIERTVVDLASTRSVGHMGAIVDDLVTARKIDLERLAAIAQSVGRRGKPGTVTIRTVLERRLGINPAESELERRGRRLLATAGLPTPRSEYPIPWAPYRRFDDAYPKLKLAIEWDSRRYHGQLTSFEDDRERDRDVVLHDWRIVRFTWRDVHERPDRVVATVMSLLRRVA